LSATSIVITTTIIAVGFGSACEQNPARRQIHDGQAESLPRPVGISNRIVLESRACKSHWPMNASWPT